MNKDDWFKTYYPIPAHELQTSDDEAEIISHSLNKWKGLCNAEQYGLTYSYYELKEKDDVVLEIGWTNCSLCVRYFDRDKCSCGKCPLARSLGHPCDQDGLDQEGSVHKESSFNPYAMVDALEKAIAMVNKERSNNE